MKIIITIKDTARVERIEDLGYSLVLMQRGKHLTGTNQIDGYSDVIESIEKEV